MLMFRRLREKVVQSLKEIVNCSDLEIYSMLVECNMDPYETVNRLLSQGPSDSGWLENQANEDRSEADGWRNDGNISE
ncbi:unnamed protein product [Microthlaspi erraticum]|uniref:GBF-interacting protein 1 N-terminal domain-containing protein n=1 Tax=Microthlaspi erraticum TaxID=1685480 RepID=A0A6D2JGY7_9BRAS|nr:unnamed protein product [Microthlaspi erraticum]